MMTLTFVSFAYSLLRNTIAHASMSCLSATFINFNMPDNHTIILSHNKEFPVP